MRFPGFLVVSALAAAAGDAAAINKCVAKDGKVTFQEEACPEAPPPGARGGARSSGNDPEDDHLFDLVMIQSQFDSCAAVNPGFRQRHAKTLAKWRSEKADLHERLQRSARYQAMLRTTTEQMSSADARAKRTDYCEREFIPRFKLAAGL